MAQHLEVTPKSSAPAEHIKDNILTNIELIDEWFERCEPLGVDCVIASAGPSLEYGIKDIRDNQIIITVKHALPRLKKMGIVPEFCSVLDPRSIYETSTLGHTREDLYKTADKSTTFIVASMTDPSVTRWLLDNGYRVLGYHTMTPEMTLLPKPIFNDIKNFIIQGGTSSATRSVEIAHFLGFRQVTLAGFDCSFAEPKPTNIYEDYNNKATRQMYLKVNLGGQEFFTTGELVAQWQDVRSILANPKCFTSVKIAPGLSTSLVNKLEEIEGNATSTGKHWEDYLD